MSVDIIARALAARAMPQRAQGTGLVASRINIPSLSNASYKQMNFRRWFRATDDLAAIQIAFPNWYASNTVNEAGSGGTAVFTASIERLDGSVQAFRWGGATASPTVADGATSPLTDALALSTPLKRGEWFAVRGHGEFSSAIVFNSLTNGASTTVGDAMEFAASGLADKTMSGTIGTQANLTYGPCLVIGATRRATLALYGDSRVKGANDSADGTGDVGEVARSVGAGYAYVNCGTASETLQGFLTNASRRLALSTYATHAICNYGVNDLNGGRTAAQVLADMAAFAAIATFDARPLAWTTINPRTTSSDAWSSLANQTVASWEASRVTINDTLRARRIVGVDEVFDICAVTESVVNSGKWAIGNGGQALTSDGLHLSPLGLQMIKASGCIAIDRFSA